MLQCALCYGFISSWFKSICNFERGITRIRELYVTSFHKVNNLNWCEQADLHLSIFHKGKPPKVPTWFVENMLVIRP